MKKVGVLCAIFLALGAFVYFYEIAGKSEREETKSLEESLLRMKREEITGLEILRPEAEGIILSKEAQQWVIVHPVETFADGSTVDVLLRDLSQTDKIGVVDVVSNQFYEHNRLVQRVKADYEAKFPVFTGFLQTVGLMQSLPVASYQITNYGREFLAYLTKAGISDLKPY